jgi:hypothetical protein
LKTSLLAPPLSSVQQRGESYPLLEHPLVVSIPFYFLNQFISPNEEVQGIAKNEEEANLFFLNGLFFSLSFAFFFHFKC